MKIVCDPVFVPWNENTMKNAYFQNVPWLTVDYCLAGIIIPFRIKDDAH